MRDLTADIMKWHGAQASYALAVVIGGSGSTPRPVGTAMAVDEHGAVVGGISGGCVEAAVHELCLQALCTRQPHRERFGIADADSFAAGLACGGTIDVLVHSVTPADYPAVEAALSAESVALVRDVRTGAIAAVDRHRVIGAAFDDAALAEARAMLDAAATGLREICHDDRTATLFVESFAPPPRMILCGAIDVAAALARLGRFLGYRVTVCDARPLFATPARVPDADEVVVDWPDRYLADTPVDTRTVVCVLTHDPKFDVPALEVALRLPAGYVGAMGSRRADADRRARLRAAGVSDAQLARLHSPIGLQLGGRTAAETALAIGAEIVAVRHGGTAVPLSATTAPIHQLTP